MSQKKHRLKPQKQRGLHDVKVGKPGNEIIATNVITEEQTMEVTVCAAICLISLPCPKWNNIACTSACNAATCQLALLVHASVSTYPPLLITTTVMIYVINAKVFHLRLLNCVI